MDVSLIDREFARLLEERDPARKITMPGRSYADIKRSIIDFRVRLRMGIRGQITTQTKLRYLMASGWRPEEVGTVYTRKELIELLDKAIRLNKESRAMGGAYVLELLERNDAEVPRYQKAEYKNNKPRQNSLGFV